MLNLRPPLKWLECAWSMCLARICFCCQAVLSFHDCIRISPSRRKVSLRQLVFALSGAEFDFTKIAMAQSWAQNVAQPTDLHSVTDTSIAASSVLVLERVWKGSHSRTSSQGSCQGCFCDGAPQAPSCTATYCNHATAKVCTTALPRCIPNLSDSLPLLAPPHSLCLSLALLTRSLSSVRDIMRNLAHSFRGHPWASNRTSCQSCQRLIWPVFLHPGW